MAGALSLSVLCINDLLVPHHLLEEVLVRVPLRDVFRCMSVCKLWRSCIRDGPYFKRRFILHRIKTEQASSQHLIYRQCVRISGEILPFATPICSNIVDGPDLSLNFLPFLSDESGNGGFMVWGSSNGLLLCSPQRNVPRLYYICNPLTRQWLILPPSPYGHQGHFQVGFVCEPLYCVQDGDSSLISLNDKDGFKVVRWGYFAHQNEVVNEDPAEMMHFEIFSSDTGCWMTSMANIPASAITGASPINVISYNGMVHWLLTPCRILIFNPYSEEAFVLRHLAPPSDALQASFNGLSQCQGSLWVGQTLGPRLRVYTLGDSKWCLRYDVDILKELHCSLTSVKDVIMLGSGTVKFQAMHPSDPKVGYLSVQTFDADRLLLSKVSAFLECNFVGRTLKVLASNFDDNEERFTLLYSVPFPLPPWPTRLPAFPALK